MLTAIPNPATAGSEELARLASPPAIAWPTLALFVCSVVLWTVATTLAVQGYLATGWAIAANALASYWFFTVFHEAAHRAIGKSAPLNDWLGRISIMPLVPFPIFRAFRFIHMQHHRFANESSDKDPDAYTGGGAKWLLPLRWATIDLKYYAFYLRRMSSRPRSEQTETVVAFLIGGSVLVFALAMGWGQEVLLYWLLPGRIALVFLALAFDYLPHHPRLATQQQNPWQATNNRVGYEWLLTPVLMWQNYHLVHHLYPRVPFYRYLRVWRAGSDLFMPNQPLLVDILGRHIR
ncbi:fatty acid desaturase [Hydrocarboniclastica marina]|nr:fatty acid desaturase [Hydrocarboniclastica marina]